MRFRKSKTELQKIRTLYIKRVLTILLLTAVIIGKQLLLYFLEFHRYFSAEDILSHTIVICMLTWWLYSLLFDPVYSIFSSEEITIIFLYKRIRISINNIINIYILPSKKGWYWYLVAHEYKGKIWIGRDSFQEEGSREEFTRLYKEKLIPKLSVPISLDDDYVAWHPYIFFLPIVLTSIWIGPKIIVLSAIGFGVIAGIIAGIYTYLKPLNADFIIDRIDKYVFRISFLVAIIWILRKWSSFRFVWAYFLWLCILFMIFSVWLYLIKLTIWYVMRKILLRKWMLIVENNKIVEIMGVVFDGEKEGRKLHLSTDGTEES